MFKNESIDEYKMIPSIHKLMVRGIVFFGASAILLAGLIFLFPAFIGFLVGIFLLATGLIALVAGYRFYKIRETKIYNIKHPYSEFHFSKIYWHDPTYYHFQTIRFIRW